MQESSKILGGKMQIDFCRKVGTVILTLLFVFSATLAFGQIVTGSVSGVVEDQQHAMVSGAKITAHQDGTSYERTTTTTDAGLFALTGLPLGTYTVTIEAPKFSKLKINNVGVTVARDSSLGVRTLTIGTTEVVNVEGTQPMVESTTTQIATSFDSKKVADLPVGSGYDMLALFVPGVAPTGSNDFSNTNGTGVSANGQRGRSNNFMIDGQANNDNSVAGPAIFLGNNDLIGEFQVITNYSAEFGRNMGSVINYITKSGGNGFHGTAAEQYTGNWADAMTHQEHLAGQTASSKYVENKWGLTLGGPIVKDKAFFFFSYFGDHVRSAGSIVSGGSSLTPTPLGLTQLQAAFPGNNFVNALATIGPLSVSSGNPVVNPIISFSAPTTGATSACANPLFVSGTACTRMVSDGATTVPVEFGIISRSVSQPSNDREITGRVDLDLSSKDRLTARYIIQDQFFGNATGLFAAGMVVDVPARAQQVALDWTRTFTPRFVNSFRFNYARLGVGFEGGTSGCVQATLFTCPTSIGFANGNNLTFGLQTNLPQGRLVNNSQWQDNASWVHGRHTLKFGGEYTRQRSPNIFLPAVNGSFLFSGSSGGAGGGGTCATLFPAIPAAQRNTSTCGFSRALRNTVSNGTGLNLVDGPPKFEYKEKDFAFYAQDEWRVKDNLTLILGVRYEFFGQAIALLHNLTVTRESDPATAFWNMALPQSLTTIHNIPNDTNNWGPNIGFAWTPKIWQGFFGENKTVVRGGFRIAYDPSFYNIFLNVQTNAPVVNSGILTSLSGSAPCSAPCLPAAPFGNAVRIAHLGDIPTGSVPDPGCAGVANTINPGCRSQVLVTDNFHNPMAEQWNFGIQRQVTSKIAFEIRYVGNHVMGQFQGINANPVLTGLIANGFDGSGLCGPAPGLVTPCQNVIPAGVVPCADATQPGFAQGRVDCNHRNVTVRANSAWSIYHGMQSRLDIQNWHGVSAGLAYTWSKTMDNTSEIFSTLSGGNTRAIAQNPFNINIGERGLSGLDYPHVFTLQLGYELPWYKSQQGVMGHVLGGWQINLTHRYNSGQRWSPAQFAGENTSCQTRFIGTFSECRPFTSNPSAPITSQGQCTNPALADCGIVDFNSGLPTTLSAVRYILNDDVAAQFFGTPFGNTRRNAEVGQTINNTNMSIFKTTRITERFKLRFEAQAYNVLNRQFLGVPDPVFEFGAGDFGTTFFNDNGGNTTNATEAGIGRRRLAFRIKLIF
jgi:hypothetical protein